VKKLFSTCKIPIAVTLLAIVFVGIFNIVWLQLLAAIMIAVVWMHHAHTILANNQNFVIVVKRVDQLKKFSAELQDLVNKELALVQEDVLRIKNIVSDSIQILQTSTNSICDISAGQSSKIEKIYAQHSEGLQNSDKKESMHHIKEQLQNMAETISEAGTYFKELEAIAERASHLNLNSVNANQASANHVSINQSQNYVQASSNDALTSINGPKISHSIQASHSLLIETISEMSRLDQDDSSAANEAMEIAEYHNTQRKIQENIMDIMRALQFEDIVSQVSERVAQHVGDIRVSVDILSHLPDSELSTSFDSELKTMRARLDEMREKLAKVSAKQIASQQNMDEGDIDLF
jgi:hypothetical protein